MSTDLLTLQNRLKRDPMGYREEFLQQVRHFMTNLQIFKLQPLSRTGRTQVQAASVTETKAGAKKTAKTTTNDTDEVTVSQGAIQSRRIQEFCALIAFLSHTGHLYQTEIRELAIPQELFTLLFHQTENLDPFLRKTLVQALILLQKRGLFDRNELTTALFRIFRCSDKELRKAVFNHLINDIYKFNQTKPDVASTNALQKIVFTMTMDEHPNVALKAVHLLVELWKRHVWVSDRVVNAISQLCFTTNDKLISAALYFFLGEYNTAEQEEDELRKENISKMHEIQQVSVSLKHMKKKMKKTRMLERAKKALRRNERELEGDDDPDEDDDAAEQKRSSNMFPLKMIYDPQHFGERLFYKLKVSRETFQTRMLIMEVLSHLIGVHKLLLFNYYPFIQRYLQPHQRHVTTLLTFVIRATHPLVPPEVLGPVVKTIANQFVTDRSTPEVIAIGVNSIREVCSRAPLVMTPELLHDLVQYSRNKNKGIMSATRSLLNVFRELNPSLLHRRLRGKEAQEKLLSIQREGGEALQKYETSLQYGGEYVHRDILGAQLLDEAGLLDANETEDTEVVLKRGKIISKNEDDEWDPTIEVDIKEKASKKHPSRGKKGGNDDGDMDGDDDDEYWSQFEEASFDGMDEDDELMDEDDELMDGDEDDELMGDMDEDDELMDGDEDDELMDMDGDEDDDEDEDGEDNPSVKRQRLTQDPEADQMVQIIGVAKHVPKAAIRILTPADFKKIELLKQRKKEDYVKKRRHEFNEVLREDMIAEQDRIERFRHQNFVDIDADELTSIRVKKGKMTRDERLKQLRLQKEALRQGEGNNNQIKHRTVTNIEKGKATKAYAMVKYSKRVQDKSVVSFKDRQKKIGAHVKTLQNMHRNLRKKVGARGRKASKK